MTDSVLHFFDQLINQEICDNQLWIRTRTDGSIIMNIPKDVDPKTYVIKLGQQEECYSFLGQHAIF